MDDDNLTPEEKLQEAEEMWDSWQNAAIDNFAAALAYKRALEAIVKTTKIGGAAEIARDALSVKRRIRL